MKAKQELILQRTRKGVLKFVKEHGGTSDLGSMHAFSEKTFFIAHQSFSKMMEGLVDGGFLTFDYTEGKATLTELGAKSCDEAV